MMLAGLRCWWSDEVQAPLVNLHLTPTSLLIGAAATVLVAMVSIVLAIRGLQRLSVPRLLAGSVALPLPVRRTISAGSGWVAGLLAVLAVVLAILPLLSD